MTQSPQSGRATARSGLRMDADVSIALPKIPYGGFSPIRLQGRYVRQGLPLRRMPIASIGWPPPFVLSAGGVGIPVLCRGAAARLSTSVASGLGRSTPGALAPVWVLLSRSILTYSAPSAPLAGASRFHRWRLIRDAFAVRHHLGDPRVVPCFRCAFLLGMPSSVTAGSSSAAPAQFLRRRRWPSP